jgi:Tol biopolymer transport system component
MTLGGPAGAYSRPGHVVRVSLTNGGQQANGNSGYDANTGALGVAITPDGRYVAFVSAATNLAAGTSGQHDDVYVKDLRTGRVRIASVASDGSRGVGLPKQVDAVGCYGADYPSISADGRYVAFTSCYVNLTGAGRDVNAGTDVFVHDMRSGKTTMVSVSSNGTQERGSAWQSSISRDGRYVVFTSTDVGALDGSPCQNQLGGTGFENTLQCGYQVYVHDMKTARTWRASATPAGQPADSQSFAPSISADDRYVSFTSEADNLAPNDVNRCLPVSPVSCPDVYLHDLRTGRNELVSVAINGQAPAGSSPSEPFTAGYSGGAESGDAFYPTTISADDRYVVFGSNAPDLVPSTPALAPRGIYVRDRKLGRTMRVSVDSAGQPLDLGGFAASVPISANGRFVVLGDNCSVHDILTGATYALPVCTQSGIAFPQLTADGRHVAFVSDATNLVGNDTNKATDVFVYDQGPVLGAGNVAMVSATAAAAGRRSVTGTALPGLRLLGARVVSRPRLHDLFVRIDVADMPQFGVASPTVVYGVDFAVGSQRYEFRAGKVGGGATFGLFRATAGGGWARLAGLRGGYGTTGQSVVAAIPVADLSTYARVTASGVVAFSALGGFDAGAVAAVQRLPLRSLR